MKNNGNITEHSTYQGDNLYRDLFEESKDAIFISTPEGKFIDINPAGVQLFGYDSKEDILETHIAHDIYAFTEDRLGVKEQLEKNGYVKDYEVRLKRKDGTRITVMETATVEYDEYGDAVSYRGILRDITDKKKAEAQLQRYMSELVEEKRKAEEQAGQLRKQTIELIQAREAALEASRLKSEFVANMSHEIRTPLNGIIGMTGLLHDTECTKEQKEFVDVIYRSGEALLNIVNNILDFSKIEAGKLKLENVEFDLRNAVEETLELLALPAFEKNIEIGSLIYSNVPTALKGDVSRFRQILMNLIGNAIKFTEEGEVIVRAKTERETDSTVTLLFTVTDTGIGISGDDQRKLFRSFSQVDGSSTRKYEGTGLGLVISKQLVEMMNGEIGVDSEKGIGSTFWFTAVFEKQYQQVTAVPVTPLQDLKDIHVLIVDDNNTNLNIVNYQVSAWGMRAQTASSGKQGLELLRKAAAANDPFELVLLDMHMPEMNGIDLAKEIKRDKELSGTSLIMLTSIGSQSSLNLKEAGIAIALTKPVRQAELFQCIANVMGKEEDPEEPATIDLSTIGGLLPKPEIRERVRKTRNYLRILIAEDNPNNQKVASFMIRKLGHRSDVAGNGKEVVDALEYIPYDIVFMDCHMPEMDGFEATREIRRREGDSKHTLIIAMTANALEGDRERCIRAGMDDYMSKPVKLDVLNDIIRKWIKFDAEPEDDRDLLSEQRIMELKELTGPGEPDLLQEMIKIFLRDIPRKITEITKCIEENDPAKLVECGHYLKGCCANIGALAMATLCLQLESIGKAGTVDGAAGVTSDLEKTYDRTKSLLMKYME